MEFELGFLNEAISERNVDTMLQVQNEEERTVRSFATNGMMKK